MVQAGLKTTVQARVQATVGMGRISPSPGPTEDRASMDGSDRIGGGHPGGAEPDIVLRNVGLRSTETSSAPGTRCGSTRSGR